MAESGQADVTAGRLPALPEVLRRGGLQQVWLLVALAAGMALLAAVVLWSTKPDYGPLYGQLDPQDAGAVMEALDGLGIPYRVNDAGGGLEVPVDQVPETRLRLAAEGLPSGSGTGFELLQQDSGFGTSQFIEQARYQHALETEIARSIESLQGVAAARVHLAVPKPSVFIRDRESPTASVVVRLHAGRTLSEGQVQAMVHLVSSSVPGLSEDAVSVVDQAGQLLTREVDASGLELSSRQLAYKRSLEDIYVRRIRDILAPMVGRDGVRAQVNADLDFARTEQTQELYDPDANAIRSEQLQEQTRQGMNPTQGIPGALSNQPPPAGTVAPAEAAPAAAGAADDEADADGADTESAPALPTDTQRSTVRNYELDRTIRHTQLPVGEIRRLSVAVVVNQPQVPDEEGNPVPQPLSEAQVAQIRQLVQDAVGLQLERGDSLNVTDVAFQREPALEPAEPELWEQPWVRSAVRHGGVALIGILLILLVLRPLVQALIQGRGQRDAAALPATTPADAEQEFSEDRVTLSQGMGSGQPDGAMPQLADQRDSDSRIEMARQVAARDPALVANVVRNWVTEDE